MPQNLKTVVDSMLFLFSLLASKTKELPLLLGMLTAEGDLVVLWHTYIHHGIYQQTQAHSHTDLTL